MHPLKYPLTTTLFPPFATAGHEHRGRGSADVRRGAQAGGGLRCGERQGGQVGTGGTAKMILVNICLWIYSNGYYHFPFQTLYNAP